MSGFNLPPGVSANDPHINPDDTWEQVFERISECCTKEGWTDIDCLVVWMLGVDAFKSIRKMGGKFPHD